MEKNIKNKIFRELCKNDICIMNPGYVISTKAISKIFNISYYLARKYCNQLREEGLIEFIKEYIPNRFSYEGELEQEAFWNIGWKTTKKAFETKIWKQEEKKEEKIIKEVWGE